MAIGSAVQQGSSVKVYDERGSFLFSKNGQLVGYTFGNVSIRKGDSVETYDERRHFLFSKPTF